MKITSLVAVLPLVVGTVLVAPAAAPAAAPKATLTIKVRHCDGCTIGVVSASTQDYSQVWSRTAKVSNNQAVFNVPADKMKDLSFTVGAPWEGATDYVTGVVVRYAKTKPGDVVTFAQARTKKRASGCWAGTTDAAPVLKLKVRKVRVDGVTGRVWGTIAWFKTTQEWQPPMQPAWKGVIGRQDVLYCDPS